MFSSILELKEYSIPPLTKCPNSVSTDIFLGPTNNFFSKSAINSSVFIIVPNEFLSAKTNNVSSREIKIIEADKNIYFSNSKDIVAKGDKLLMDVEKNFISIKGDVEFIQGKSIIRAEKINVDLDTQTVDFEGIKDSYIKN